jgi:hypothetical protein
MSEKPTTVEVRIDPALAGEIFAALSRSQRPTIRLAIKGVTPPENRKVVTGFRVFVDKPDAKDDTPETDPHYIGAVTFQPAGEDRSPQGFALDMGPALAQLKERKLLSLIDRLRLTFIVNIAEGAAKPEKVSIPFREVAISLPPQK